MGRPKPGRWRGSSRGFFVGSGRERRPYQAVKDFVPSRRREVLNRDKTDGPEKGTEKRHDRGIGRIDRINSGEVSSQGTDVIRG